MCTVVLCVNPALTPLHRPQSEGQFHLHSCHWKRLCTFSRSWLLLMWFLLTTLERNDGNALAKGKLPVWEIWTEIKVKTGSFHVSVVYFGTSLLRGGTNDSDVLSSWWVVNVIYNIFTFLSSKVSHNMKHGLHKVQITVIVILG